MHLDEMSCTDIYAIKEEQRCLLNRDGVEGYGTVRTKTSSSWDD